MPNFEGQAWFSKEEEKKFLDERKKAQQEKSAKSPTFTEKVIAKRHERRPEKTF